MPITFRIAEPCPEASEVAVETRNRLADWLASKSDELTMQPVAALSKEEMKDLRTAGAGVFDSFAYKTAEPFVFNNPWGYKAGTWDYDRAYELAVRRYNHQARNGYEYQPASQATALIAQLTRFMGTARRIYEDETAREFSYKLEGAMQAFSRQWHERGCEWTPTLSLWIQEAVQTDGFLTWDVRNRFVQDCGLASQASYWTRTQQLPAELGTAQFGDRQDALRKLLYPALESAGDPYAKDFSFVSHMAFVFAEGDGPWVCGFLNPQDMLKARFTRKRLGAFLADSGAFDDVQVRAAVETAKCKLSNEAQFVVYPNDVLWGQIYVNGEDEAGSCMAHSTRSYDTWDDIHPVDVYSAAHFGAGDNGLALFTSVDNSGKLLGRGIVNTHGMEVIRWYSDRSAERCLSKLDVRASYDALRDSWLALVQQGSRFIHPYVDGDSDCGTVDGNRIIMSGSGDLKLQDTRGSSYLGETHWCTHCDERHGEDRMTYQEVSGTWICTEHLEDGDGSRCPCSGEMSVGTSTRYIIVDKETMSIEVGDHVELDDYMEDTGRTASHGWGGRRRTVYRPINLSNWAIPPC